MEINADFSQPATVKTAELDWTPSPMKGVDRKMLDRVGDEVARATSIVRYAKGSAFSEHTHSGGEEFIVLDGVFQDEHGDYPAGTYVRNPVGTHHIPRSDPGCTIFVKLWQFDPADQEQMSVDLNSIALERDPATPNVLRKVVAHRDYETVSIEEWSASASIELCEAGGFELFLLSGTATLADEDYGRNDWIRWPSDQPAQFETGQLGARMWVKRGHLADIRVPGD